jgi:heme-degrading monooxygenase HmoA
MNECEYTSQTVWANACSFEEWKKSPQFESSHAKSMQIMKEMLEEYPEMFTYEGFMED